MKILVIENEYPSVQFAFEAANQLLLDNKCVIEKIDKSQNIKWDQINLYTAIFIDLSLSIKSELDGYGIIQKIKEQNEALLKKVCIITGNSKVEERLVEKGLDSITVKIFEKPLKYKDIADFIKSMQSHL